MRISQASVGIPLAASWYRRGWIKFLHIWDVEKGESVRILKGHQDSVQQVAWSADGSRIASASTDRTIRIWNAKGPGRAAIRRGHENIVTSIAWSGDSARLASGSWDQTIRLWASN